MNVNHTAPNAQKKPRPRSATVELLQYARPYWKLAVIAPLLMVIEVVMDLMQPRLTQAVVDQGIAHGDMPLVLHTGLLMIGCAFLGALGGILNTVAAIHVAQNSGADLRRDLYRKIHSFSFRNLDQFGTGQLITRLTNDVTQLQEALLATLRIMVRAPLMLVGSLVMAILTSPRLALLLLLIMPFLIVIVTLFFRGAHPLFLRVQERLDRLNTLMQENLSGVRVVKSFVREDYEQKRFGEANEELALRTTRAMQFVATVMPLMMLVMNIGVVAALWFGGVAVTHGTLHVGQVIAFINYLTRTLMSVIMVSMLLVQLSRAGASADRIAAVMDTEPDIQNPPQAAANFTPRGRVAFEHVTFGYANAEEPALRDISMTVEPGQTVAILGATGSGKSSLVHLIPRFYDVTGGRILLDGVDVRELPLLTLRRSIGMVLQESLLFSGTIRDNIRYGKPEASEAEVVAAAKAAQAHDFITALPDGYDTQLGQQGVNLSGGQKQRLSIARALLIKPSILILDDSTSAVDVETETRIETALRALLAQCTVFVIAQRISTVLNADKIIVLDKGQLVAEGAHAALLASCPIYQEIYESQLGAPEAATL